MLPSLKRQFIANEEYFLKKYSKLLGFTSTASHFVGKEVEDYTHDFVLPLINKSKNSYPLIKDQIEVDSQFIEKHLVNGCTIIDAGCGSGKVPLLFSRHKKVKQILAFDASQDMINKAIELCNQHAAMEKIKIFKENLISMDAQEYEKPIVTCMFGTLGGIIQKKDRIKALKNLKKMSRNGTLLLSVFNNENIQKALNYYAHIGEIGNGLIMINSKNRTYFLNPKNKFFTTWYSKKGLVEELNLAGLNAKINTIGEQYYVKCENRV